MYELGSVKYTLKLHMKGMNWTDDLNNKDTPAYKETATKYCDGVSRLFDEWDEVIIG